MVMVMVVRVIVPLVRSMSSLHVLVVVMPLVQLVEALLLDRVRCRHGLDSCGSKTGDHGRHIGIERRPVSRRIHAPRRPRIVMQHQIGHGALRAEDVPHIPTPPYPPNPTEFIGGQAHPPPMPALMLNLVAMNDWKCDCTGWLTRLPGTRLAAR